MKYENICKGKFIERPNRFVAMVDIDGRAEKVHVKNTGRCRELLVPGAAVYMEDFAGRMGTRKLRYSLTAVEKEADGGAILINMDSQAPNRVVEEALKEGRVLPEGMSDLALIRPEYQYGDSRMDFYLEDIRGGECLVEVKGVTLEQNGIAEFPDAPTERGVKHIGELIKAKDDGCAACMIFVIQMKGPELFRPNYRTHGEFGDALRRARLSGVQIAAYDCIVEEDLLKLDEPVAVSLDRDPRLK